MECSAWTVIIIAVAWVLLGMLVVFLMKKNDESNKDDEFYNKNENWFWLRNRPDKNFRIFMTLAFAPLMLITAFMLATIWRALDIIDG